jgi:hypothetical protein
MAYAVHKMNKFTSVPNPVVYALQILQGAGKRCACVCAEVKLLSGRFTTHYSTALTALYFLNALAAIPPLAALPQYVHNQGCWLHLLPCQRSVTGTDL